MHYAPSPEIPSWLTPMAESMTSGEVKRGLPDRKRPVDSHAGSRPHRDAAVAVLFTGDHTHHASTPPDDATVVLTQRSLSLSSHSGQIAFPGGAVDDTDTNVIHTALRETEEETGIPTPDITACAVMGQLYIPVSNYSVSTVLAHWQRPSQLAVVNEAETTAVMSVPVSHLLDPAHRFMVGHPTGWTGPAFSYNGLVIWGFTAGILCGLFRGGGWEIPWDTKKVHDVEKTLQQSGNAESAALTRFNAVKPAQGNN